MAVAWGKLQSCPGTYVVLYLTAARLWFELHFFSIEKKKLSQLAGSTCGSLVIEKIKLVIHINSWLALPAN